MDQPTHATFIPKRSLITKPEERPVGLFLLLGIFVFLLSLALWGGAYFYVDYLGGNLAALEKSLDARKDAFELSSIRDLERMDTRLRTAKDLLARHRTLVPLFDIINQMTLKSIRFKSFTYAFNPMKNVVDISMNGEALNYESIAIQSDLLAEARKFKEFVFSDLSLDQTGKVAFRFAASLDPEVLLYSSNLPQ